MYVGQHVIEHTGQRYRKRPVQKASTNHRAEAQDEDSGHPQAGNNETDIGLMMRDLRLLESAWSLCRVTMSEGCC
jgi:hypothetical protein